MSLLYKDKKDIKYKINIVKKGDKLNILFTCDGGKHGCVEILDEYNLTVLELLKMLQDWDEIHGV